MFHQCYHQLSLVESVSKVELVDEDSWLVLLESVANKLSCSIRDYTCFITFLLRIEAMLQDYPAFDFVLIC
jgi:hypothetical protein